MCLGAMPGGIRRARWTQIDAIARADMPCRPLERRLPCQMIFGKAWNRALTAVRGRLGFFLQIIARANVPWSAVWRGSRCSMDTNRCHRASRYALEAPRMAIALPDELQESVGPGTDELQERERLGTDELQKSAGPRPDDFPESERPGSTPAATLSQCSVATRVCLSWNKDFQLPRRYN